MIGVGVIGYGYWGPNVLRNLYEHEQVRVAAVCDSRQDRLEKVHRRYPGVPTTTSFDEVLANPAVDAIFVCTPVHTHFPLAMKALQSGRHVLVEKPLASSVEQAARLVDEARRRNLHLMVDHTFVFTPAVRKIRELMESGAVGRQVYYYDSVRVNLGLFQRDVNVLWDLAVHDLSIMDYVLPGNALAVSATGASHLPDRPENLAYLTCFLPQNLIAHIHVNWLAPVKLRQTLIGGDQKMIIYNDLEPSEKIRVYDKGVTLTPNGNGSEASLVDYRSGDMWAPKLPLTEALQTEVDEFVQALSNGRPFPADGEAGLRVVQILEAASYSMKNRGLPVELNPVGAGV
ncbi:MAG: Gfo/Idh/MocA family protein [Candidatus Xenobium sp.]|jgi:predicted dehydrogenase